MLVTENPTTTDENNGEVLATTMNPRSETFDRTVPVSNVHQSPSFASDERGLFRLRLHVEGFQPNDLDVKIERHSLIVRGRTFQQDSHRISRISTFDENDDNNEPDFICKQFKRTFPLPANADPNRARAELYVRQGVLIVEIPLLNMSMLTQRNRFRPIDIFFTIVIMLFIDRTLRSTYEQFVQNDSQMQRLIEDEN